MNKIFLAFTSVIASLFKLASNSSEGQPDKEALKKLHENHCYNAIRRGKLPADPSNVPDVVMQRLTPEQRQGFFDNWKADIARKAETDMDQKEQDLREIVSTFQKAVGQEKSLSDLPFPFNKMLMKAFNKFNEYAKEYDAVFSAESQPSRQLKIEDFIAEKRSPASQPA